MVKFTVGMNNGWFADKYAVDLGYSQFSESELWHWPYDEPVPIDLSKPDPNLPRPLLSDHPELIDQYFSQVHGIDVVRIWVFERLEGIRFDANNRIVGIDNDLLNNALAILNSANAHGIKVYFCLFDSWVVKHAPPQGLPASRLIHYDGWNAAVRNIIDLLRNYRLCRISSLYDVLMTLYAKCPVWRYAIFGCSMLILSVFTITQEVY